MCRTVHTGSYGKLGLVHKQKDTVTQVNIMFGSESPHILKFLTCKTYTYNQFDSKHCPIA